MTSIQLNIGDRLNKSLIKNPEYKISYDQATTIDDFLVKIQKQTDNKINQIIYCYKKQYFKRCEKIKIYK